MSIVIIVIMSIFLSIHPFSVVVVVIVVLVSIAQVHFFFASIARDWLISYNQFLDLCMLPLTLYTSPPAIYLLYVIIIPSLA